VIREHPDVEEAAVVGVAHETWGEVGHAFVRPSNGAAVTEAALVAFCQERLASYKVPKKIFFRGTFPTTSLGKIRKSMLAGRPQAPAGAGGGG
jgi:fatty-acyl-CoA synthase